MNDPILHVLGGHMCACPLAQWESTHILSELQGSGTLKLDWRYLEHNRINRNDLQIHTNSQKGTGTKMAE